MTPNQHAPHITRVCSNSPKVKKIGLANRLLYHDEWNIPADRTQVAIVGEAILQSSAPEGIEVRAELEKEKQTLGKDWSYVFQSRHRELKFVSAKNKDKLHCNTENWYLMNDFHTKV